MIDDETDVVTPGAILRRDGVYWYYGLDDAWHGSFGSEHAARDACAAAGITPIAGLYSSSGAS